MDIFTTTLKTGLLFLLIFSFSNLFAQGNVGINDDGSTPNAGAILDLKSTDKGLLIPRMTTAQRILINGGTPADGMMVYDTDFQSFWYYNGTSWINFNERLMMEDADQDTKIQVEESPDEDIIRFDVEGIEVMRHDGKTLHAQAPGGSLFIGNDAGLNDDGLDDAIANENTFVGESAGYSNTVGIHNTILGNNAGAFNVSGYGNTFIGRKAGYNTTSSGNTFLGSGTGYENTSGNKNTMTGYSAGYKNTSGNENYFFRLLCWL